MMPTSIAADVLARGKPFIVDADSHWTEPHDLFTRVAPAKYRDRVPRVEQVDGVPYWMFDGHQLGRATAAAVIGRDGTKASAVKIEVIRLQEFLAERLGLEFRTDV